MGIGLGTGLVIKEAMTVVRKMDLVLSRRLSSDLDMCENTMKCEVVPEEPVGSDRSAKKKKS